MTFSQPLLVFFICLKPLFCFDSVSLFALKICFFYKCLSHLFKSGRGQAAGAPGPSRPVSSQPRIKTWIQTFHFLFFMHRFIFCPFLNLFSILQNIPPRAGVISVTPKSRPLPPSHPGAPRPIPEVHPGAPRPLPDTHPGAPRPVPSAQANPPDLPMGK